MGSLLKRAHDLRLITPAQYRAFWIQMGRLGYRSREPIELDIRGEDATLLRELVETHTRDLRYSTTDMRSILPLEEDELQSQYLSNHHRSGFHIVTG